MGRNMSVLLGSLALAGLGCSGTERGREPQGGGPWVGGRGITVSVGGIMARGAATLPATPPERPEVRRPASRRMNPDSPQLAQVPAPPVDTQGSSGTQLLGPLAPQTVGTTFLGVQFNESGTVPPDSSGAVGPTQIMVCTNGRIKVFDKQGNLGGLNVT